MLDRGVEIVGLALCCSTLMCSFSASCRSSWRDTCCSGARRWYGIGAPRNTPAEIVDKLNKEINAALSDPKIKARLADLGGTVLGGSAADFGKLIADETEKWGKVIRAANLKPG
jgi:hypothetical protein